MTLVNASKGTEHLLGLLRGASLTHAGSLRKYSFGS